MVNDKRLTLLSPENQLFCKVDIVLQKNNLQLSELFATKNYD